MSNTRIYIVESDSGQPRLIDASSQAAARSHAARSTFRVRVPAQIELYDLAQSGVKVESAHGGGISDESRSAIAQVPTRLDHIEEVGGPADV